MVFTGLFIDTILNLGLVPEPSTMFGKLVLLLAGIILIGFGSLFYLRIKLGAGPMDGFVLGLGKTLDKPIGTIRLLVESAFLDSGLLLSGPVGIGTLVTALFLGYLVQLAFKIGKYDSKSSQMNLYQSLRYLQGQEQTES